MAFMRNTSIFLEVIAGTGLLWAGLLSGCATDQASLDSAAAVAAAVNTPGSPESLEVVDCLLPGQIRQLGTHVTYLTERRPVRTTAEDCGIRGGEYTAADRADYGTALKVWLGAAQKGEAEAQYYAGTLYERGATGSPDYQEAAVWYRKAADQGYSRAAISLSRLYEQGLGVRKDSIESAKWLTKASGLSEKDLSLLTTPQEARPDQLNALGFEGPSLEIIDPPLSKTRGLQDARTETAVPVSMSKRRSITGRVLAPAGLRTLTVNGEAVKPDDSGIFTATVPGFLSVGNEILVQVLAIDMQNKRAAIKFVLNPRETVQVISATPSQNLAGFGRYHALVIGNDHYQHWPELMNAISDATAVTKLLRERYDFQVTLLKDSTRTQIMKALNQYRKMLTEKDNLLIYYAGHGHLERDIDRGYWIPVDAEVNDNSEWVLLPSVTDMLQLISAKHILVVADSCFSGKLTRAALAQLKPGLTEEARLRLLQTLAQKRVRTAMTSGGVKPVLDAGGNGHSVFAEALIGVLEENTSVLEAERLFWAVRARAISASQKINVEQIPTYDPIHMAGHESVGDFIFVPR
jgi:uncharacterized caspase-like protein